MILYDQFPLLKSIPLFAAASPEHVERSFRKEDRTLCHFEAGDTVYSSNAEAIRVGVLISGEV